MPAFRAIMDTNVLLSALWSRQGAAFQILQALRRGEWVPVLSNHLLTEYEEVCKRHAGDIGLSIQDIDDVLDAICAVAEEHGLLPGWVPVLRDPDDEPIVQLAVEASVPRIVTHNIRHLKPAASFGINVLTPAEFLARLRSKP
jgi:putative PIN family toxin of toxin-antitoxin system